MTLEMTQFIRPNGRKQPTSCEISDDLAGKVKEIHDAGLRFTAEVVGTNVSFCIESDEEDLAIEIVSNGPGVRETVENMIRKFKVQP